MYLVIHTFLRSPFLITLTVLSLLLVAGIILSDWAEKRRDRRLRDLVRHSRELSQLETQAVPALDQTTGHEPGSPRTRSDSFRSRFFGNRYFWLGIICVTTVLILLPVGKSNRAVRARAVPGEPSVASGSGGAALPADASLQGVPSLWYTNDLVPGSSQPSGVQSNRLIYEGARRPATAGAPIVLSDPDQPVADPDAPAGVDEDVARSIHPDQASPPEMPPLPARSSRRSVP